jgi:uncharacterized membrane protein
MIDKKKKMIILATNANVTEEVVKITKEISYFRGMRLNFSHGWVFSLGLLFMGMLG